MRACLFMALLISPLCCGLCSAETATFIFKNGKVEFGELKRMSADSVFLEKTGANGAHENAAIGKDALSEVVFDSGDKLNLSLQEYPVPSSTTASSSAPVVTPPVHSTVISTTPAPPPSTNVTPAVSTLRSPFIYGGLSAIVPGLGQLMQTERIKGAVCFGIIAVAAIGTVTAWNYTTSAYDTLQKSKLPDGSYNADDFQKFTFRLHGAQALTCVTAILYALNIADATADAFIFNKQSKSGSIKPALSISPNGVGCTLSLAF